MPDSKISNLEAAGILPGDSLAVVVQGTTGSRTTTDNIRQQGGNLMAATGTANQDETGAVGPGGEAGSRFGSPAESVIYRDATVGGVSFNVLGVKRWSLVASALFDVSLGLNNFTGTGATRVDDLAIGSGALQFYVTGARNVGMGKDAAQLSSVVVDTISIGHQAAQNNTVNDTIAVGRMAGKANTTGARNVALGQSALLTNTAGSFNVVIGSGAASVDPNPASNVVIGQGAQTNTAAGAFSNVSVGRIASSTASGDASVALGHSARAAGTGTSNNATCLGYNAGNKVAGSDMTAVGYFALANATTGTPTTAVGSEAGRSITTGARNLVIGQQAGYTATPANAITTGVDNIAIGYQAGPASTTQRTGAIALGASALFDGDYAVAIGKGTSAGAAGSVALGIDNGGGSASTTTANEIKLGTTLHTVTGAGVSRVEAGTSAVTANVGSTRFTIPSGGFGNTGTVETDLDVRTIQPGMLGTDGDKLEAVYGGTCVNSAATKRYRVYFAGTLILDSTAMSTAGVVAWMIDVEIIRESSSVVRCIATGYSQNTGLAVCANRTRITGLSLNAGAYDIKVTGTSAGGGASNNDIVLTTGRGKLTTRA